MNDTALSPVSEHVYYQDTSVTISSTRAIFGASTYPVRNITSLRISKRSPSYAGPIVLILFGLFIIIMAAMFLEVVLFLVASAFIGIGAFAITRRKTVYFLTIGNAGTEFTGTTSYSREYISVVHDALSASITNYR